MVHADSAGERSAVSPCSGGMASPYSDHSVGLPSPPTVVMEYNRSYEVDNPDEPHLVLVEQPQNKFRFRYKSEMVGTHGQLKAERAGKDKNIFPTLKLVNWNDGPALVRLALYTGEDNSNLRRRHVHELSGKNCDKDTGMCEVVVDHETDFTATFQNLGIIHIAKRDVKDIILQRKKTELLDHARLRRPHSSPEELRQIITPTDIKKFDKEAEEIAKTMDLNKVVLRFQAFHYDDAVKCFRPITRAIDSELVVNLKNASTGELKIVRMSECSAPCTGGTEVWMLVEKVKKSNIKIKFFELDSSGNEVWTAYGEFSEGDVHHQYAIVFRTPPYRTSNLRSSVRVKVQLERPNDKDISEPRDFTYYPETRKRLSPFSESTKVEEDEDYHEGGTGRSKRHCLGTAEPLDLRFSNNGRYPGDIMEALTTGYYSMAGLDDAALTTQDFRSPGLLSAQSSPQYSVPSPGYSGESPNSNSSHSFYHSIDTMPATNPSPLLQVPNEGSPQLQLLSGSNATLDSGVQSVDILPSSPQLHYLGSSPMQAPSPQYQVPSPQQMTYQQSPSPMYQQSSPPVYQHSILSPQYQFGTNHTDQQVPNSVNQSPGSSQLLGGQVTQHQQQHQQQQQHMLQQQQQQLQMQQQQQQVQQHQQLQARQQQQQQRVIPPIQVQESLQQQQQNPMSTLHTPSVNSSTVDASVTDGEWDFSNLVQGNNDGLGDFDLVGLIALDTINSDFFTESDLQADCMVKKGSSKTPKKLQSPSIDVLSRSMASVALVDDEGKVTRRGLSKLPDTGLVSGSVDVAFRVAVSAAESLQAYAATGDLGRLLATHRYLLAVQNRQGDNALHTAVSNNNWAAFNTILKAASSLRPQDLLNMQNFSGETPLHIAVRGGNVAMAARLIAAQDSDVSLVDKRGNNPLHLAAALPPTQYNKMGLAVAGDMMEVLLTRPRNGARSSQEEALLAYNYQGETPLHVAVCGGNLSAVQQLVAAGAEVHLCERRRGSNCLHLAAQHRRADIARYLIEMTDITVNSRMFDGNTALHMAVQEQDADMCRLLIDAGADPTAKNALKIRHGSGGVKAETTFASQSRRSRTEEEEDLEDEEEEDEEDDEEDDEPNCYTPLDYAGDNAEVLRALQEPCVGSRASTHHHLPATVMCSTNTMDSGIDISVADFSSSSVV